VCNTPPPGSTTITALLQSAGNSYALLREDAASVSDVRRARANDAYYVDGFGRAWVLVPLTKLHATLKPRTAEKLLTERTEQVIEVVENVCHTLLPTTMTKRIVRCVREAAGLPVPSEQAADVEYDAQYRREQWDKFVKPFTPKGRTATLTTIDDPVAQPATATSQEKPTALERSVRSVVERLTSIALQFIKDLPVMQVENIAPDPADWKQRCKIMVNSTVAELGCSLQYVGLNSDVYLFHPSEYRWVNLAATGGKQVPQFKSRDAAQRVLDSLVNPPDHVPA
jgi:hypothetical protein